MLSSVPVEGVESEHAETPAAVERYTGDPMKDVAEQQRPSVL